MVPCFAICVDSFFHIQLRTRLAPGFKRNDFTFKFIEPKQKKITWAPHSCSVPKHPKKKKKKKLCILKGEKVFSFGGSSIL